MLNMAEKIILLTLDNTSGKTFAKATYLKRYGLSAALLFELMDRKKIQLQGKNLIAVDESPTGYDILDKAFEVIKKSKKLNRWIFSNVAFKSNIRKEILKSFIDSGIVKEEEKRFLGFIPLKRYPITNEFEKRNAEMEIRNVLLEEKNDTFSSVFLSSIVVACRAESLILTKEEKKKIAGNLKLIAKGKYYKADDEFLLNTVKAINMAISSESAG
ncbi:MAG TPA: GPP34 family phosphoprotein [Pseudobacteroides sp.]|uniref:GOLPH3/VPS74 family protein n=1 Tax=Pseudobacteroides sp. TaxID=1968840 RepID=UPI002F957463